MTPGSSRNYYRDEVNNNVNQNNADNYRINSKNPITRESFETKLIGNTANANNTLNEDVVVPLKYLINFWRSLDLPLINCEIEVDLTWSKRMYNI